MVQNSKILFLTRLYFPHIGGVEKHVAKLSEVLISKGFNITVVTEQHDSKLLHFEKFGNVSIYRIPVSKNVFLKKFYIWKWILFHFKLFYNADLIHIHDVFYWILPFRPILMQRIFMTFHGYEGYPVRLKWKISRKIAEKLTDGNICVGDFLKKWYNTVPSSVLYGGVKLKKENITPNEQSAVFFGRLDDQTGILEYIKAYSKIRKVFPKFKMTVVGEGKFKNLIPKGIKVHKFTDAVESYIIRNHFIFVSRYLSMLEALSQKRTVVAVYDNPIKKDYLLMSPFKKYVSMASSSDEIAEIVLKYLADPKRERNKNEKGYEWAKEQSWEKVANEYIYLWKK